MKTSTAAPDRNRTRWLELIPGIRLTKTLLYKLVTAAVKQDSLRMLENRSLCQLLEMYTIEDFCKPLKGLVEMVAELF